MNTLDKQTLSERATESGIPDHMIPGLVRYVYEHIATGGFWRCVLEGDIAGAEERADELNSGRAQEYFNFLEANVPVACFGNAKKVSSWIARSRKVS